VILQGVYVDGFRFMILAVRALPTLD